MAKLNTLFSYEGTFREVTSVDSRAYGKHIRAKRGTYKPATLNEAMKKSGELLKAANGFAKVIKDAFEPYLRDYRDGTMWIRLVTIFKKQLGKKGTVDLGVLDSNFTFNKLHPLGHVYLRKVEVSQGDDALVVKTNGQAYVKRGIDRVDSYEVTIISAFIDGAFRATVASEKKTHPISPKVNREQTATFPIPTGTRVAVIAIRCDLMRSGETVGLAGRGMDVVKVVEVGGRS